jgi:hypothetical protein
MSQTSTAIPKVKKLSLGERRLPAPEVREPIAPGKPPTEEDRAYSRLVSKYPLLDELIETLDLVSTKTGDRLRIVAEPPQEPVDSSRLIALASKIPQPENSYSQEEVISRLREATQVNQERAERGFKLMLQVGAIEPTVGERYYLPGSTPF